MSITMNQRLLAADTGSGRAGTAVTRENHGSCQSTHCAQLREDAIP